MTGCSPQVDSRVQIIRGNQNWNAMYRGVSPEYLDIRRWPVVAGVPFTEVDIATNATVCVLGQIVVDQLFGDDDPIGQMIRIRDVPFKVIGVLKTKGQSGTMNQDDTLLMPYTTAQRRISGNRWFQDIMAGATPRTCRKFQVAWRPVTRSGFSGSTIEKVVEREAASSSNDCSRSR